MSNILWLLGPIEFIDYQQECRVDVYRRTSHDTLVQVSASDQLVEIDQWRNQVHPGARIIEFDGNSVFYELPKEGAK